MSFEGALRKNHAPDVRSSSLHAPPMCDMSIETARGCLESKVTHLATHLRCMGGWMKTTSHFQSTQSIGASPHRIPRPCLCCFFCSLDTLNPCCMELNTSLLGCRLGRSSERAPTRVVDSFSRNTVFTHTPTSSCCVKNVVRGTMSVCVCACVRLCAT